MKEEMENLSKALHLSESELFRMKRISQKDAFDPSRWFNKSKK